jgi:hypothetical protein
VLRAPSGQHPPIPPPSVPKCAAPSRSISLPLTCYSSLSPQASSWRYVLWDSCWSLGPGGEQGGQRSPCCRGSCCLPLVRRDGPHLKQRLGPVLGATSGEGISTRRFGADFEISNREGPASQQTVATEGLCGKMVKFGLKQAVSVVMSCC